MPAAFQRRPACAVRCVLPLLAALTCVARGEAPAGVRGDFKVEVLARGLQEPNGLAVHPQSGEVYVAEKAAGRVSVLRNGAATPVIESGWTLPEGVPNWAVNPHMPREKWLQTSLQKPGAIALATNGHLFVAEEAVRGRLLEFIPDAAGKFTTARVLPIPWLDRGYAWDDVKVDIEGRIFIVGADAEVATGPKFGTVLMRDVNEDWWVIDYGPFIHYSSIYLSQFEDILVVAERGEGGLTWWDLYRRLPIGTAGSVTPGAELETVGLLPDGAFALGVQATAKGNDARIVRLDPLSGEMKNLAEGFASLGAIVLQAERGTLLATDPKSGLVVECTPPVKISATEYLLQRSQQGYESAQGFTPRTTPAFLRNFFSRAMADMAAQQQGSRDGKDKGAAAIQFSLRDFASKIPLVAGRIKTSASDLAEEKDPVEGIDFVLLFPGRVVLSGGAATPSMSFVSIRHKSGKVDQTRLLFDKLLINRKGVKGDWVRQEDNAALYVPIVSCGLQKDEAGQGMSVNLVFLGLGIYDDYYLNLWSGKENRGSLVVETKEGQRRNYQTAFTEVVRDKEVKNLVVAGFDPMEKASIGWLNIGRWPVGVAVSTGDIELNRFSGVSEEVAQMLERKEAELRFAAGVEAQDWSGAETGAVPDAAQNSAPVPDAATNAAAPAGGTP